ncbi:MAG: hypothetical protein ACD_48C00016G0008 [uncultured bacterium]|nr:MAG: hypothetical protein ACD_48C00016G0008 [uncultured bacterium]
MRKAGYSAASSINGTINTSGGTYAQTDSPGGTYVRRKALNSYITADANDGDPLVH